MKYVIEAKNLGKRYRLHPVPSLHNRRALEANSIAGAGNGINPPSFLWALRDVSFSVREGEIMGIIGPNGAGKTTLLKILSRITAPTCGQAWIHGRLSSLLAVGAGFHPDLSGRENIFFYGALLGMRSREIARVFDAIVDFSGLTAFLDIPVKHYSRGMYFRLAFSVAVHLASDIFILDEILAVGDTAFQKKCIEKMKAIVQEGRTLLLVTHRLAVIENLCHRVLYLREGVVIEEGLPHTVIRRYLKDTYPATEKSSEKDLGKIIKRITLLNRDQQPIRTVSAGDALMIKVNYRYHEPLREGHVGLTFESLNGIKVFFTKSQFQKGHPLNLPPAGTLTCHIPRLLLMPGSYFIHVGCGSQGNVLDYVPDAIKLEVVESDLYRTGQSPSGSYGLVFMDVEWQFPTDGTL